MQHPTSVFQYCYSWYSASIFILSEGLSISNTKNHNIGFLKLQKLFLKWNVTKEANRLNCLAKFYRWIASNRKWKLENHIIDTGVLSDVACLFRRKINIRKYVNWTSWINSDKFNSLPIMVEMGWACREVWWEILN